MKWTAETFRINSHRNYSLFTHRQLIFTGICYKLFYSGVTQYGQVPWYSLPSWRLSQKPGQGCRDVLAQPQQGRQQCPAMPRAALGLQGSELCPPQPQTILGWAGLCHPHPSVGGRAHSIRRWDFRRWISATSAECTLTLRWSEDENICPDFFFFLNRFTIAKGKAIKNPDFLMVWEQQ